MKNGDLLRCALNGCVTGKIILTHRTRLPQMLATKIMTINKCSRCGKAMPPTTTIMTDQEINQLRHQIWPPQHNFIYGCGVLA